MGVQHSENSFYPGTALSGKFPIHLMLQTLQTVESLIAPFGDIFSHASPHLRNITRSLQGYIDEENVSLPFLSDMESLMHIAHGGFNVVNPYHSFLEGQKGRKLMFESALAQVEYIKSVNMNPFLTPYLQQIENFIRTNLAFTFTFDRPEWGLKYSDEKVGDLDFCSVVKFSPDEDKKNGKNLLLVAPMSGHFATLLRKTVESLCAQGYTVFITDWKSPLQLNEELGEFDTQRYTKEIQNVFGVVQSHIQDDDFHVLAVCQPSPETLTAVAHSEIHGTSKPASVALMAGPIDTSVSPTKINFSAEKLSPQVMQTLQLQAPYNKKGTPRKVYPAALQILGFIMTKPEEHLQNFYKLATKMTPFTEKEENMLNFYREYFAVMDLPFEFYQDTVNTIFRDNKYAAGSIEYMGEKIDFSQMKTPLITFEAANDDITGLGQTKAANDFCKASQINRYVLVQPKDAGSKVGHYGVFAGERFRSVVIPLWDGFIGEVEKLKKAA